MSFLSLLGFRISSKIDILAWFLWSALDPLTYRVSGPQPHFVTNRSLNIRCTLLGLKVKSKDNTFPPLLGAERIAACQEKLQSLLLKLVSFSP